MISGPLISLKSNDCASGAGRMPSSLTVEASERRETCPAVARQGSRNLSLSSFLAVSDGSNGLTSHPNICRYDVRAYPFQQLSRRRRSTELTNRNMFDSATVVQLNLSSAIQIRHQNKSKM